MNLFNLQTMNFGHLTHFCNGTI